jgi:hypothetical protein
MAMHKAIAAACCPEALTNADMKPSARLDQVARIAAKVRLVLHSPEIWCSFNMRCHLLCGDMPFFCTAIASRPTMHFHCAVQIRSRLQEPDTNKSTAKAVGGMEIYNSLLRVSL